MKKLLNLLFLLPLFGCTENLPNESRPIDLESGPTSESVQANESIQSNGSIQGLKSLYMGHSYFRRQADAMEEYAEVAGIIGHESTTFFRGGYNG